MLHHLGDVRTDSPVAILTGDPERVDWFAAMLGRPTTHWNERGYHICEVDTHDGLVLVASTGIGGPSTAIVVEELGSIGVETFVRVGTCGSLHSELLAGTIVVSTGCIRDEGTSSQYLPLGYAAVPEFGLVRRIVDHLAPRTTDSVIGLTHCKDAYYAEGATGFPLADEWQRKWTQMRSVDVLATEMEAAPLFAVATVRQWSAAALFVAVDDSLDGTRLRASLTDALGAATAAALEHSRDRDRHTIRRLRRSSL